MAENVAVDRLLGEIVAALDGELTFPYDAAEGVHACEILLGTMPFYPCFASVSEQIHHPQLAGIRASHAKNGAFVSLPMAADDRAVAVARWA